MSPLAPSQGRRERNLVVEKDRAARLELVLVDKGENVDVVLTADRGGHDGVVIVDHLLQ